MPVSTELRVGDAQVGKIARILSAVVRAQGWPRLGTYTAEWMIADWIALRGEELRVFTERVLAWALPFEVVVPRALSSEDVEQFVEEKGEGFCAVMESLAQGRAVVRFSDEETAMMFRLIYG